MIVVLVRNAGTNCWYGHEIWHANDALNRAAERIEGNTPVAPVGPRAPVKPVGPAWAQHMINPLR